MTRDMVLPQARTTGTRGSLGTPHQGRCCSLRAGSARPGRLSDRRRPTEDQKHRDGGRSHGAVNRGGGGGKWCERRERAGVRGPAVSALRARPGPRSTAGKAGRPSQRRRWPGRGLGKVPGSSFHTQERHSPYPFVQQAFPECLLASETVLSDTKDVKEGPALCLRTQAAGSAGGGGPGRKGTCKAEEAAEARSRGLGPGRLGSGRRGRQDPGQGKPRHKPVPRA